MKNCNWIKMGTFGQKKAVVLDWSRYILHNLTNK